MAAEIWAGILAWLSMDRGSTRESSEKLERSRGHLPRPPASAEIEAGEDIWNGTVEVVEDGKVRRKDCMRPR